MQGHRGSEPEKEKNFIAGGGIKESHELFFGVVDEVKLDDANLPSSIHQLDKKAVVHSLISAKMDLSIYLTLGYGLEFLIELGERNGRALESDRPFGIDRNEDDFGGCVRLPVCGGKLDLEGRHREGGGEHKKD